MSLADDMMAAFGAPLLQQWKERSVDYWPKGGSSTPILATVSPARHEERDSDQPGLDGLRKVSLREVHIRRAQLDPAITIKLTDSFVIDGAVWAVDNVDSEAPTIVRVSVSRDAIMERVPTGSRYRVPKD